MTKFVMKNTSNKLLLINALSENTEYKLILDIDRTSMKYLRYE